MIDNPACASVSCSVFGGEGDGHVIFGFVFATLALAMSVTRSEINSCSIYTPLLLENMSIFPCAYLPRVFSGYRLEQNAIWQPLFGLTFFEIRFGFGLRGADPFHAALICAMAMLVGFLEH